MYMYIQIGLYRCGFVRARLYRAVCIPEESVLLYLCCNSCLQTGPVYLMALMDLVLKHIDLVIFGIFGTLVHV